MSNNWVADIDQMHEKFGAKEALFNGRFLRFRQEFLEEELREFGEAIEENNPQKAVDALIDMCVVAIGTLDLGKVNSAQAWDNVLTANLQKEPGPNPTREGSGGFDLIKPEGWVAPTHENNIGYFGIAIQNIHDHSISKNSHLPNHIKIMDEWKEFSLGKSHDYDDKEDPEFQHASYYPDGINNIVYELYKKVKRIRRNLKRMLNGGGPPKTDSLNDSLRDINVYSAIGETYMRGELEGQFPDRDIFNRQIHG